MESPNEKSAVVTFNNQNSVLMTMYLDDTLCLLHDNRIFGFKRKDQQDSSEEQALILSLLTTAKFRLMGFLYSGYRLVDNTLFLLIVVLSIANNGFTVPQDHEKALFAAIGLEGFYDVMLYTHRYWILQRLSIFIGIVLYIIYFTIVGLMACGKSCGWNVENPEISINVVWIVLGIRFAAFVLEELVDIAIDLELHNDLIKLNLERSGNNESGSTTATVDPEANGSGNDQDAIYLNLHTKGEGHWSRLRAYLNVSNAVAMSEQMEYIGSIFAWGQRSVFDKNVWEKVKFPRSWSIYLCVLPIIPAVFVFIPIFLLCCAAGILILIMALAMALCTGNCRAKNYLKELLYI